MFAEVLFVALIVMPLLGAVLAAASNGHPKASVRIAFTVASISSLLGLAIALMVFWEGQMRWELPFASPFGSLSFTIDALGAFFLGTISVVAFAVSLYSIGYSDHYEGKYPVGLLGAMFNVFYMSMVMVVSSSNAILFLIMWETMSLSSFFLVTFENRNEGTVHSGMFYLIMTHIGTAAIGLGFLLTYAQSGSFDFSSFPGATSGMSDLLRSSVFLLWLVGFGAKAGIIPLHVWLPLAHPAAPSNVSAMMSAVMVKTAIYMLIRCCFGFLGVQDAWWGIVVLAIGCVSALLGVMYALIESDIKRMLAFSTVENIGIILIALGVAMVFKSYGLDELAALAMIACLMHVLSHALFKSLLFMGAGSVLYATHTRNMERLGGLAKRMPYTSAMFFVGALSASAIPPLSGFISEWLIFQAMLQSFNIPETMVKILIPVALGTLAITGALAAAAFLKTFGITFLARPRSCDAEGAHEVPRSMLWGMGLMATLCVLVGVLSFAILPTLDEVAAPLVGASIADTLVDGIEIAQALESSHRCRHLGSGDHPCGSCPRMGPQSGVRRSPQCR
jgi:hydrogenase-4 component B